VKKVELMKKPDSSMKIMKDTQQLKRLKTVIDVVFAIIIWRIFMLLPRPGTGDWSWKSLMMDQFLGQNWLTWILIVVGLFITIDYWTQNNVLFGNLVRTNGMHTALSILQVFFLLLFLYAIRMGVELEADPTGTRVFESITALLIGITSVLSWLTVMRNPKMLAPEVTKAEAREIMDRFLPEPITAAITIAVAYVGPIFWEISWFSFIPIIFIIKGIRKARNS
jgi:uncharacterized membrane protein